MRKLTALFIGLTFLTSCDCYLRVAGTVIDTETGRPLQGVTVYNTNKTWIKITTDSTGHFELTDVSGGFRCPPMKVRFSFQNYSETEAEIPAGAQKTINMQRLDSNPPERNGRAEADTVKELGNNIMIVYQDKKNTYWFGSWENGLYTWDGKTLHHYSTKNGLPNNRVDEIKEDVNGTVYINTSSGIVKFIDGKFIKLNVYDSAGDWKLEQNDLWFKDGWNSGSIYRYDGKLLHRLQLPKVHQGEEYISKNPGNSNPYTVYSMYKDSKGSIWFGTGALGAFRFNGTSFDWIIEKDVAEIYNDPSEPSNGVRSIIEDQEGYFWFNSKFRYQVYNRTYSSDKKQNASFYSREKSIGSLDGKSDGNLVEYLSIAKDNKHELWIVTYNQGVWRYDGKNSTHYSVQDNGKDITLFSIYKDNKGDLWLGTQANGAFKFNGKDFIKFK